MLTKIGSGDITWTEIIEKIAKKNKPVIIATGAANLKDVTRAYKSIIKFNKKLIIMQCNTNYTGDKKFKLYKFERNRYFQKKNLEIKLFLGF